MKQRRSPAARRRKPRVGAREIEAALGPVEAPAPSARESVSLLNISEAGVAVVAPAALGDVDDTFVLRLVVPGREERARCQCRIRYTLGGEQQAGEHPLWLHGVEFRAIDEETAQVLRAYVHPRLPPGDRRATRGEESIAPEPED